MPEGKSVIADKMENATRRPGSLTFLLVGLVLLVTAMVLFVAVIPCVYCPMERHNNMDDWYWPCPLCGEYEKNAKKVTLWRRWFWKPQSREDWLGVPLDERPKIPGEKK
jgi:hypothetical protein